MPNNSPFSTLHYPLLIAGNAAKLLEDLPNKVRDLLGGIRRMFQACRKAEVPEPEIRLTGNDLWLEFPFAPEYMRMMQTAAMARSVSDMPEKSSEKSSEKILRLLAGDRQMTIAQLADMVGITSRGVEKNLEKLQRQGHLRRIGPAKGGHWEVIDGH